MDVSVHWHLCVLCVFVCVRVRVRVCVCMCMCVISNQSSNKKPRHTLELSKLGALFHKTHRKVLVVQGTKTRYVQIYNMVRSLIQFKEIRQQKEQVVRLDKIWKRGEKVGRQYRGILLKLGDQEPSANQIYFRRLVFKYTFTKKVLFSCIRKFFANICFRCFRYLNFLSI